MQTRQERQRQPKEKENLAKCGLCGQYYTGRLKPPFLGRIYVQQADDNDNYASKLHVCISTTWQEDTRSTKKEVDIWHQGLNCTRKI